MGNGSLYCWVIILWNSISGNSAQRVITLIVSPLCAIALPCMMRKIPKSNEVTRGSNTVNTERKMFSAMCTGTSAWHYSMFICEKAWCIWVIWKFSLCFSSIAFALLTSWIANSKRNINSTLRQPTCSVLHTLMTSWSQTWPQSKSSNERSSKTYCFIISVWRCVARFLIMTPKIRIHLKSKLRHTLETKAWIYEGQLINILQDHYKYVFCQTEG